jgi:hypothetical protein
MNVRGVRRTRQGNWQAMHATALDALHVQLCEGDDREPRTNRVAQVRLVHDVVTAEHRPRLVPGPELTMATRLRAGTVPDLPASVGN